MIDDLPRREVLRIRLELMLRAVDEIQREIAELDRLGGAPMAKQRRGLQVVDGGTAKPRRR
jgi:hypothetical protein